ncbi:hypothetical protein PC116_g28654, partial [Phytophthora cactorum]
MPLLPEIPSYKSKKPARNSPASSTIQGADKLPNPFHTDDAGSSGTKIAVRTEEEQQAAAREREERERAEMEKEINDRREARRKSLANRRVSFAAEATLHTFHEVEYMQDSTTSTDSTRRASSLAASQGQASDSRSGSTSQADDLVPSSPEQDTHDQRRRRSSGVSNLGFSQNDDTMASSIYSSDSEGTDVIETHEEIGSDSGSDSDADGVSMDLDVDEVTGTSVASAMSARSAVTNDSDDTLNTALRLASRRAETQNLDEEEEIIPSFGWAKKPAPKQASPKEDQENLGQEDTGGMDMDMDMDMDMTNAVGGIIRANDDPLDDAQEEEMSMDVTRALGGILPSRNTARNIQPTSPEKPEEESLLDDAPMDLTVAVGGIQKDPPRNNNLFGADDDDNDEDEDMSMEFTAAVGSVLSGKRPDASKKAQGRRRTLAADDDEATMDITAMDMTVGVGRILSSNEDEE